MSSGGANVIDIAEVAKAEAPVIPVRLRPGATEEEQKKLSLDADLTFVPPDYEEISEQDLKNLPRVAGPVPWQAYTIAFIEFCERFSYYGTTIVFTNYIQQHRPEGSRTGASHGHGRSGGFGKGQQAAYAVTTFNSFWAYFMPILGAYIADEYLGRFNTILGAIFIAIIGHVIMLSSALPSMLDHPSSAFGCFFVGLIIMGIGTGGFKSNISPLIAEQIPDTKKRIVHDKNGKRQILDPIVTIQRVYMYFYLMINLGSLVGQISMVYAEQDVGFWLSFTMPTVLFCICPMVMFLCRNNYARRPPTGSVVSRALRLWTLASKGRWSINPVKTVRNMRAMDFWENVKPSKLGPNKPKWMDFDDQWVDEVRRGIKACTVFLWYPFYWLTYNQMTSNLTSQAATMNTGNVPNDLIQNLDPLFLVIFIPLCDQFIYPWLRKKEIRFTALKRIFWGFMTGVAGMIIACIIQYYIYKKAPPQCGKGKMNDCADITKAMADAIKADTSLSKQEQSLRIAALPKGYADINVWVQTPAYILIALSEIFASITGLEYAFTKAPANMRSLVMSMFLFTNAVSSAIAQGFTALSTDPLLVWNYAIVGIIAFVVGIGFWISHRKLDLEEDHLNMLPEGHVHKQVSDVESDDHVLGHSVERHSQVLGEKGLTTTPPEPHPASKNVGMSNANELGSGPTVRAVN